ncbi:MAG: cell division protein ZapA [Alistipes sp.]|nr:cell division protein ZapA [Alistipes sp.]
MSAERKLEIKLEIVGKTYSLKIDPASEEVYRLAAREINSRVAEAQLARYDGFRIQDYLSLVAVDLMIANIRMQHKDDIADGEMQVLKELSERLSNHLAK